MTMRGIDYDYSDHGESDGTQEACDFCFDPEYVEYEGQNWCLDCIEQKWWQEIGDISWEYIAMTYKDVRAIEDAMSWMQVELIDNPKTVDFVGFKVSFLDDEREISVAELEANTIHVKKEKDSELT
jgi:hypothetical protein